MTANLKPSDLARREAVEILARWVIAATWDSTEEDRFDELVKCLPADVLGQIEDKCNRIAARPNWLEVEAARRILRAD